jgi:serine/threonine-protein kinase HipA
MPEAMSDITTLEVALYGRRIGALIQLPGDRTVFAFDQRYIDSSYRPTLGLSFQDAFGALITETSPAHSRLPPFFANLLPEGLVRDYLAKKTGVSARRELDLLSVLGRDLPGAITISSVNNQRGAQSPQTEAMEETADEARLQFSLPGKQLKFSATPDAEGHFTISPSGAGGSWIIKLPFPSPDHSAKNEYAMMQLAGMIGIDVPETRLIEASDIIGLTGEMTGSAIAVKRFDRTASGIAVHCEDFAQIFAVYPDQSDTQICYSDIAQVIWVETGATDTTEFIRRLVFSALIGNHDMHVKNWSLIYPDRLTPKLAPAYDLVSNPDGQHETCMKLTPEDSESITELSLDRLTTLAAKARLPRKLVLDTARDTVKQFLDTLQSGEITQQIDLDAIAPLPEHLHRIPLLKEI